MRGVVEIVGMIDSPYLAVPGKKFKLDKFDPDDSGKFKGKDDAVKEVEGNLKKLDELQEVLYAQGKHSVLIVFQAMDAGGRMGLLSIFFRG